MRSGILVTFIVLSLVLLSSARRPSKGGKGGGRPSKGGKGGKGGRPSTGTTKPPSTGGYGNGYGKPSKGKEGKEGDLQQEQQNPLQLVDMAMGMENLQRERRETFNRNNKTPFNWWIWQWVWKTFKRRERRERRETFNRNNKTPFNWWIW